MYDLPWALFLIPGVDETLRVNGKAGLRDEPGILAQFATHRADDCGSDGARLAAGDTGADDRAL